MCELTYVWEGHLVCFNSKESNGRATEGVMTTIVYSMMICVQFHDNDITHSENYFCAQCDEYFVWILLSTYQGDSGGVLMMQEKSGSGRWIQVLLIRRLFIEAPSEHLHFWPVDEINWWACHRMQALPRSQVILIDFNFEVGVHAYVVNAYVNGNIVESHFKAVRWKSFSSKSNQDWCFINTC